MSEWQKFAAVLREEDERLGELGDAALALTDALVANVPEEISVASGS
jgi:hypothetical protein